MTIVELKEITDTETRQSCYERIKQSSNFDRFKNMFEEVSGKGLEDIEYRVLRQKGQSEPSVIVFRVVDEYKYELRGNFSQRSDDINLRLNVGDNVN